MEAESSNSDHLVNNRRSPPKFGIALLMVISLVFSIGYLTERVITERKIQTLRSSVIDNMGTIRAKLEGTINNNLMLVRGLLAEIFDEPDLNQDEFADFVRHLMSTENQLRNIGAAPDMVISLMYPLEGNEAAIGLNYRTHPLQKAAAMRVVETGEMAVAGPVNLLQGGQGFIARLPVYLPSTKNSSEKELWGLISAVIDVDKVYHAAGLTRESLMLDIAIRGKDGLGESGNIFYGNSLLFDDPESVTLKVTLPNGLWQLAARPKGGWLVEDSFRKRILVGCILITLLLAAITFSWMSNYERKKVVEKELRRHQEELEDLVAEKTADLQSAKEAAEKANRAKSSFLENISHELRTPMHAILSFSRMGTKKFDDLPPEKLKEFYLNINQSAERLMVLLNDLLDLSKLEAGHMILNRHKGDLKDVIEIGCDEFMDMARIKSITFDSEDSEIDLTLHFDQNKILQVVRNLLSNAIKFSPEGGNISILFAEDEITRLKDSGESQIADALTFVVADEGDGIPEGELDDVFDKFVQSSKTHSGVGGTGLGLAISKEIIERHGGTIRAENGAIGARFIVSLPREMLL